MSRFNKLRRSLLYLPGVDQTKLMHPKNAVADCLVFDLEDTVSAQLKGQARQNVFQALESNNGQQELCVRINPIGSGLEVDDLSVILRSKKLSSIVIPKVSSQQDIEFVARMIQSVAPEQHRQNVKIMAMIESAKGLMQIREIATSEKRVECLLFAAEDYCADVGIKPSGNRTELTYARQRVVTAAKAFGLDPIDMVCTDGQLEQECTEGRSFGFVGKQATSIAQIDTIHSHFGVTEKDVEFAKKIVQLWQDQQRKNQGSIEFEGRTIYLPTIKWAEKIVKS
ncbi:Pyruvate/Phosphoenolpyruvate kinase-like domain-containing protein [Gorgonomyces haynaldii]|nr:Pyruvate/Phosphoenolpyruvate kinase-like domain-containing protein [Gorgonomyces haynaldii]